MNDTTSPGDEIYSMDELEKELKKAGGGRRTPWFLAGLLIGIAGTLLLPPLLRPYLPDALRGSRELAVGPVLAEQREDDRLLLTVQAEQGALLATFTERVAEIDLLVGVGDTVSLGVSRYQPFVENPSFEGVRKADASGEGVGGDEAGVDEPEAEEAPPAGSGAEGAAGDSVGADELRGDEADSPVDSDRDSTLEHGSSGREKP